MLNLRENMIVIDGQIKTGQIEQFTVSDNWDKFNIVFKNNPKVYGYNCNKVLWLNKPVVVDSHGCMFYYNGEKLQQLSYIAKHPWGNEEYWYIEFQDGRYVSCLGNEITVIKDCLSSKNAQDVFDYFKCVASINKLRNNDEDASLLLKQYEKIDCVSDQCAVAPYFNPSQKKLLQYEASNLIFPFGCNASQQKAVRCAFENQISIIQGPPGTGKTQTILNIVANIIKDNKTVLIVSNNNSAILNVVEKMNRYNMGFITALLGSADNKKEFINSQETEKQIPEEIQQWHHGEADKTEFLVQLDNQSNLLADVFKMQERLALARQELDAIDLEMTHYEVDIAFANQFSMRKQLSSSHLIILWSKLQATIEKEKYTGFCANWVNSVRHYVLVSKLKRIFRGITSEFTWRDIEKLIPIVQHTFYVTKHAELVDEMSLLEQKLSQCNASQMMKSLQEGSMLYLRNFLYATYGNKHKRPIYSKIENSMLKEYPVVLSTTFSAYSNFRNEAMFDYVIMDEASQISVETGTLGLMCAKNAVIVGDSKQLPNVLTDDEKKRLEEIAAACSVDECYNSATNSFLQSVCKTLPDAPQTLLREHYRCHPKIINFCNQKFYGNNLVIMTKDNGEEDVLSAKLTVVGHHCRDHVNQREIDVITTEVLPVLSYPNDEVGIIAPYKKQVSALVEEVGEEIEVATVHKFQGREKDAIVMSVVDDEISPFADNANLLNVAISRAKQQFCLVVSGNEIAKDTNIADLLEYIKYNNCSVTYSNIRSIFDLLYSQYTEARIAYLKNHKRISEYDSENLAYAMLERMIAENEDFSHIGILCHYPLSQLLSDVSLLSAEDREYALHPQTHIDLLLYNRVSKQAILAIEVDGYEFHKAGTHQSERDEKKNRILNRYGVSLLRLSTTGSNEQQRVKEFLSLQQKS